MQKLFSFKWKYIAILLVILVAVMLVSVSLGAANLTAMDSLRIVFGKFAGEAALGDKAHTYDVIIWQIRLPRICMAVCAGGALALTGTVFQAIFGNSLADPHILGVSSGAALGATIAMLSGLSLNILGLGTIGIFAFAGALITVFFVYHIAVISGRNSVSSMLLIGTALSTMMSSVISLLMIFHRDQIEKVYLWTLGSFSAATWTKDAFLGSITLVCGVILLVHSRKINLLMLGEEDAACLGVDVKKLRRRLLTVCSILVAATVSVSGIIGFVGLIIPHCVKLVCGSDNRKVMPYGFICGSIFMVVCDTIARTVAAPSEIPVGVITSICGAPFFIWLVLRKNEGRE
jgi:iron complex transport system permease protein